MTPVCTVWMQRVQLSSPNLSNKYSFCAEYVLFICNTAQLQEKHSKKCGKLKIGQRIRQDQMNFYEESVYFWRNSKVEACTVNSGDMSSYRITIKRQKVMPDQQSVRTWKDMSLVYEFINDSLMSLLSCLSHKRPHSSFILLLLSPYPLFSSA